MILQDLKEGFKYYSLYASDGQTLPEGPLGEITACNNYCSIITTFQLVKSVHVIGEFVITTCCDCSGSSYLYHVQIHLGSDSVSRRNS